MATSGGKDVLEFSPGDQKGIVTGVKGIIRNLLLTLKQKRELLFPLLILIALIILIYSFRHIFSFFSFSPEKRAEKQLEAAERFYHDFLTALAGYNIYRKPAQTPIELLDDLRKKEFFSFAEAEVITRNFCLVKYGKVQLTMNELHETEDAVKKLKKTE